MEDLTKQQAVDDKLQNFQKLQEELAAAQE
jgi:hypothetical protein